MKALAESPVEVSMGFDKTWGQDILYPQGGLHSASRAHNVLKHRPGPVRTLARWVRVLDPTSYSFARLERRQYLTPPTPVILVNSRMVRGHFQKYLRVPENAVRVLYSAVDPDRFTTDDRAAARARERAAWGVTHETVGLFVAMNYRLKGLAPLLRSIVHVPRDGRFRLVVIGGKKFSRYSALASRLGVEDRVFFGGFQPDPRNAYFGADFLVHPTFYDPGSLVALEALACGLPVITSRYNGNHELLPEPTADYVIDDPHDARDLGGKISGMLDADRLPARKAAAAEAGNRLDVRRPLSRIAHVFEEVAAATRASTCRPLYITHADCRPRPCRVLPRWSHHSGWLVARSPRYRHLQVGSGNIGATNVGRTLGRKYGLLVFALDFAKGAVPVLVAGVLPAEAHAALGLPDALRVGCAVATFVGHMFPVYLRFRGGKGVATGLGTVLVLTPGPALLAAGAALAVVCTTRMISAGSVTAVTVLCAARLLSLSDPFGIDAIVLTLFLLIGRRCWSSSTGRISGGSFKATKIDWRAGQCSGRWPAGFTSFRSDSGSGRQ